MSTCIISLHYLAYHEVQMPRKIAKVGISMDVSNASRPPLRVRQANDKKNISPAEQDPSASFTKTDPRTVQPGQSKSPPAFAAYRTFTCKFGMDTKNFVKAKFIRRPDGLFHCVPDCGMTFGTKEEAQVHLDSIGQSSPDTKSHHAQSKWPK